MKVSGKWVYAAGIASALGAGGVYALGQQELAMAIVVFLMGVFGLQVQKKDDAGAA